MNNQLDIINMMNEKLEELIERGIPTFQAKLIVAQAAVVMLEQSGLSKDDIMKFAAVIAK